MNTEQNKTLLETGKPESAGLSTNNIGLDDFFEDLFGLNIKGVKTLWTSFVNPKAYYQACNSPNWQDKFTPAFRLWFTLSAITVFLQFFWGGNDSSMIESIATKFEASATPLPEGVIAKSAAITFTRWYFGLLPLVTAVFVLFIPTVFRAWHKKTSYVLRQRFVFATVLPGTAISLVTVMFNRYITPEQISTFANISLLIYTITCFITAFRGAFPEATFMGRLWRAGLLSACLCAIAFAAAVLAVILAFVGMGLYYS